MRDDGGNRILGFGKNIFANDLVEAKILEILEAFYIIEARNIPQSIIYSDSKVTVKIIHSASHSDRLSNLVSICR